jgi:predicted transposase/invertase (TIGR01784 family)
MKEIHQPHDRFFRSVFSETDNVRDLLRNSLPPRVFQLLDLKSIELSGDSFIDERLSLYQSDILIRARMRASPVLIYILVDHKSYPDKCTVFQMLVYMVRIWERELSRNRKLKKLPCVVPFIFYHGSRKWTYPLAFSSYVNVEEELDCYVPDFRPVMFNLQNVDLDLLIGGLTVKTALKAFKYALKGLLPHLEEILQSIPNLPIDSKTRAFISRLLEYIIQVGGDARAEDLKEELDAVASGVSKEVLMTIEELILERGKVAGKIEGTIQEKQQVLIRLLEKKFGPLDDDNKQRVLDNRDGEKLDSAIDLILDADSVQVVLSPLG